MLHVNFDEYKDAHSSGVGFAIERQVFDWIVPYHSGAVRYFREIGVWNALHDSHNQALIERQKVLQEAWKSIRSFDQTDDVFIDLWLATRGAALTAVGMDAVW